MENKQSEVNIDRILSDQNIFFKESWLNILRFENVEIKFHTFLNFNWYEGTSECFTLFKEEKRRCLSVVYMNCTSQAYPLQWL